MARRRFSKDLKFSNIFASAPKFIELVESKEDEFFEIETFILQIEDAIRDKTKTGTKEYYQLAELNDSEDFRQRFSAAVDDYLKHQDKITYGRFEFSIIQKKLERVFKALSGKWEIEEEKHRLGEPLLPVRFHDDMNVDNRESVTEFVKFFAQQLNRFHATPRTEDEIASYPLAKKLELVTTEFLKDLQEARKLGNKKPRFVLIPPAWSTKIDFLDKKYKSEPFKLTEVLQAIFNGFAEKNIPDKIKFHLEPNIKRLLREILIFRSDYIDNNEWLDKATKEKAISFFELVLKLIPDDFLSKSEIHAINFNMLR